MGIIEVVFCSCFQEIVLFTLFIGVEGVLAVIQTILKLAMLIYAARIGTSDILQITQTGVKQIPCVLKIAIAIFGVTLFILAEVIKVRMFKALYLHSHICGIFHSVATMEAASLMTIAISIYELDECKPTLTKLFFKACTKAGVIYPISLCLMLDTTFTKCDIYSVLMQMIGAVFVGIASTFP